MLVTLFILGFIGVTAFRMIRVSGNLQKRKCADNLLGITEVVNDTKKVRIRTKLLMPFHFENTWLEGEVPWTFNETYVDNNNGTTTTIKPTPTFDPLEPCAIGHLFI
jgi:hypothetical protein